jgi:ADP-ribose pyrophosphatase
MSPDATDHLEDGDRVKILKLVEDYSFRGMFRIVRAKLQYRRFDGQMSEEITRINFERGDSAGVLLYDPDDDVVLLVRQFRYPVYASIDPETTNEGGVKQAWLLEVVAGIIDPGQSAVEIASKELLEEAGYVGQGGLRPIATIYPSPGGTSERIYLFLGLVNHKDRTDAGARHLSNEEDIQVECIPFHEALLMIARGEISDAKTIIALQHLALLKSGGEEC